MNEDRKSYLKRYRENYQAKRVNITLSPYEYRAFSKAAKNEKVTSFVKRLALDSLNQRKPVPEEVTEELRTLKFAIRNIANNINQIAHYSNTFHEITHADENNLFQYLKQLEEVVQSYTEDRLMDSKDDH